MAYANLTPNLQDMFNQINDRLRKLESGPNSAAYDASNASTQATSAAAGSAAAQAIAANAIAQSTNTILNASNQLTAINGNGITVYTGTNAAGYPRVILNSQGLLGYGTGSTPNFSIDATTGNVSITGALVSGGSISGASITIGGGLFEVTSGGVLTATSGTVGGWSLSSSKISANSGSSYFDSSTGNIVTIGSMTSAGGFLSASGNITTGGTVGGANVSAVSQVSAATIATSGLATLYSLTVTNTAGITGGYGVNTSWSPNTDNTYNLGISGSYRWSHVYANNTTITTSDERLKTNIVTSPLGLNFINALRPVAYQWIEGSKQIVVDDKNEPIVTGTDADGKPIYQTISIAGKRTHYGLIAQEVKKVLDDSNVGDFAGWVQDDLNNPDSYQSVSYEQFISPLIKAVQELTTRLTVLEAK